MLPPALCLALPGYPCFSSLNPEKKAVHFKPNTAQSLETKWSFLAPNTDMAIYAAQSMHQALKIAPNVDNIYSSYHP